MNPNFAQAAAALATGRLAEAGALLDRAGTHRRGFELRGELLAKLLERGRVHLGAGDLVRAEADVRAAAAIEPGDPRLSQLERDLARASGGESLAAEQQRLPARRSVAPGTAVDNNAAGVANAGAVWLLQAGDGPRVAVLRGGAATIGPAPDADLRLAGDPSAPGWSFAWNDEDVFLAGRPLTDGDRLHAGPADRGHSPERSGAAPRTGAAPRGRFARPHPGSVTSVVTLTSGRLAARGTADVTRVVLAGRELVAGPQRLCHISCGELTAAVVFRLSENGLCTHGETLRPGHARVYDGVRFTLSPLPVPLA